MGYIRKARDEKDRFFRAIEELNRAGSPDQVFLAVLESARQIARRTGRQARVHADGREQFGVRVRQYRRHRATRREARKAKKLAA